MFELVPIFRDKLVPWVQNDLEQRLVVARPVMKKSHVPYGVELTRKSLAGKRVVVRTRDDGPQQIVRARWPDAGLHELYIPKLVCVLRGVTDYRVGEYAVTCGEGHFILLPPHMPNTAGGRSHLEGNHRQYGSCDLLQLLLFRNYIQCVTCSSRGEEHSNKDKCIIPHPSAIYLFQLFMDEVLSPQGGSNLLRVQLLSSTFTLIWREIAAGRFQSLPAPSSKSTFKGDSIQQIHEYIKTHLHQSLTIEKVAKAMHMSPSQFTRGIRQETGQSFVEVMTDCRIEETKRLLRETEWSIAAVARHVGFKSPTYFITFFGKYVGCSPGEYRAQLRTSKNDLK